MTWKAAFLVVLIMFSAGVTLGVVFGSNVINFADAIGAPDSREPQILRDPIDSDGPGASPNGIGGTQVK